MYMLTASQNQVAITVVEYLGVTMLAIGFFVFSLLGIYAVIGLMKEIKKLITTKTED